MILNGIEAIATRQDLLDRSIVLRLPRLTQYRDETRFWADFEDVRPGVLGALLDAASCAYARYPEVSGESMSRMADFTRWVIAALPAFGWSSDPLVESLARNRSAALRQSLDGSPVAKAVLRLAEHWGEEDRSWEGTPSALYDQLSTKVGEQERRDRAWPRNAQSLSRALTLLAPALRQVGIEVEFHLDRTGPLQGALDRPLRRRGRGDAGAVAHDAS